MDAVTATDIAIQSNKDYQQDVLDYTRECDLRLKAIDSLLGEIAKLEDVRDELSEDPDELPQPGVSYDGDVMIHVEGAVRAEFPSLWMTLRAGDSPFYQDYVRSDQNKLLTSVRPWTSLEVDYLKQAVVIQKAREVGETARVRGENPLEAMEKADPKDLVRVGDHLDWDSVAKTLATMSALEPARTSIECRIQYMVNDHPDVNRSPWSEEEQSALCKAVDQLRNSEDGIDWDLVTEQHNSIFSTRRTVAQCLRTYRTGLKPAGRDYWTDQEDQRLREAIDMLGTQNWVEVARYVSNGRSAQQARLHWVEVLDPMNRKGKWTEDEDIALLDTVRMFRKLVAGRGKPNAKINWSQIAEAMPGRTSTQCRNRWNKYIDPDMTTMAWSSEENVALLKYVDQEKRTFRDIARLHLLQGRTQTQCVEQYNLLKGNGESRQSPMDGQRDSTMAESRDRTESPPIRVADESHEKLQSSIYPDANVASAQSVGLPGPSSTRRLKRNVELAEDSSGGTQMRRDGRVRRRRLSHVGSDTEPNEVR